MHKNNSCAAQSRRLALSLGLPVLAGTTFVAQAQEAPPAPPTQFVTTPATAPTPTPTPGQVRPGTKLAQEATTPSGVITTESTLAPKPPAPRSSQAQSKGLVADSHLNLEFRNYTDYFHSVGSNHRHAWVLGLQANFESGFTQGPIGFGADASLFGAFKLDGGVGARNMVHVGKDGGGSNQLAWGYPGRYDVKARVSETVLKYGLQDVYNPFLEPHDNRALPPTFLGASVLSREVEHLALQAGTFTKVNARGHTNLTDMTTSYGGVSFKRLSYVGGTWDYSPDGSLSLYADQADDVWRQYYGSIQHSIGRVDSVRLTGFGNLYSTHDTGSSLQGPIDNNAYSLSLQAQHGPHALLVGYQKIFGDQFFDYVNETAGVYLVNSMDVDYNAPHEQSLQLRYTFDGKYAGLPGFSAMVWGQQGWGSDGSAFANRFGPNGPAFSSIYFKNGQPVHGRHHEFGFIPSYVVQSGRFKNAKVTVIAEWHVGSAYTSDSGNQEYRVFVTVPFSVF
ncbi:OprD family outer membrane porin [Trinickia fusca]|uniref:Outer membrane porin, OprD family n=1 Tax=Trinickia fusca TaxID=2419777 RepID=A0A494XE23_9BURK|nr:OprD family outer membrane porin [Trinickia fusca]RKP46399.1 outer membrane porin, OprD family [Trinickia fusca]